MVVIRLDAYEGISTFKPDASGWGDVRASWYRNVWFHFNYEFAQEWNATIGYYADGDEDSDGKSGMYLEFKNEKDRDWFLMRWS